MSKFYTQDEIDRLSRKDIERDNWHYEYQRHKDQRAKEREFDNIMRQESLSALDNKMIIQGIEEASREFGVDPVDFNHAMNDPEFRAEMIKSAAKTMVKNANQRIRDAKGRFAKAHQGFAREPERIPRLRHDQPSGTGRLVTDTDLTRALKSILPDGDPILDT